MDGTAAFEPLKSEAEITISPKTHQFNWFNGSYDHMERKYSFTHTPDAPVSRASNKSVSRSAHDLPKDDIALNSNKSFSDTEMSKTSIKSIHGSDSSIRGFSEPSLRRESAFLTSERDSEIRESQKSKRSSIKSNHIITAGKLCSNLQYESEILNAPKLFLLNSDGSGCRLLRDSEVYPYVKNLANTNSEVVEEAIEEGVSLSVLESNIFRQVSFSLIADHPLQHY